MRDREGAECGEGGAAASSGNSSFTSAEPESKSHLGPRVNRSEPEPNVSAASLVTETRLDKRNLRKKRSISVGSVAACHDQGDLQKKEFS